MSLAGRVPSWVRDELAIDRVTPPPVASPVWAAALRVLVWPLIALLYLVVWGPGVIAAVTILAGGTVAQGTVTEQSIATDIGGDLLVAAVGFALLSMLWTRPHLPNMLTVARTVPFAVLAMAFAFAAMSMLAGVLGEQPEFPTPTIPDPMLGWYSATLAMAGPTEELILLGIVAVGLRKTGYSWGTVAVTAVLLRVPFHLYYGWSAIALTLWALAFVVLYRRTGVILPFVLAHALWNFTALGYREVLVLFAAGAVVVWLGMRLSPSAAERTPAPAGGGR